jgi:hypothetical protein
MSQKLCLFVAQTGEICETAQFLYKIVPFTSNLKHIPYSFQVLAFLLSDKCLSNSRILDFKQYLRHLPMPQDKPLSPDTVLQERYSILQSALNVGTGIRTIVGRRSKLRYPPYPFGQKSGTLLPFRENLL